MFVILAKRDSFRAALAGFDLRVVADCTCQDVERLLGWKRQSPHDRLSELLAVVGGQHGQPVSGWRCRTGARCHM